MDWLDNLRRSFLDWNAMLEALPTMITDGGSISNHSAARVSSEIKLPPECGQ
jgi:hypothetical protein